MTQFRRTLLIEISISLVIVMALVYGIFFFRKKISDTGINIVGSRQKISERLDSLRLFNFLRSQYDTKGKRYLTNLYNLIPTETELIDLSRQFQVVTTLAGLDPRPGVEIVKQDEATPTSIGRVQFNITAQGNIDNIFKFIQSLSMENTTQNFRYLATIDAFSIERNLGESKVLMSVKGYVFFRFEPPTES